MDMELSQIVVQFQQCGSTHDGLENSSFHLAKLSNFEIMTKCLKNIKSWCKLNEIQKEYITKHFYWIIAVKKKR